MTAPDTVAVVVVLTVTVKPAGATPRVFTVVVKVTITKVPSELV